MSTFVYAPGIRVFIDSYKTGSVIDVSNDLTGAGMQRRPDGVSQFQFGLINPLRKYDNVFTPNDRIVVMMKRLTWMRTFTGYLNQVPIFSSWPRDVSLTASCSLKRLQYFFWDPEMAASQALVTQTVQRSIDNVNGETPDGGIKQVAINLLEEVVDWSGAQATKDKRLAGSKVHIGAIPSNWFEFTSKMITAVAENVQQEQQLAAQLIAALGAGSTLSGTGAGGNGVVPAGVGNLNATQAKWATEVLRVIFAQGHDTFDAEIAIGCCLQESNLYMYANRRLPESLTIPHDKVGQDHLSVGLFQQQAGSGFSWGTVAECMQVEHSTKKFLEVLSKIHNRKSLPFTNVIQKVQRSAFPNAYAKWETPARAIVAAYVTSAGAGVPSLGTDPIFQANSNRTPDDRGLTAHGTTTAARIVEVAQQVVSSRYIPYVFGSTVPYDAAVLSSADCSSFIRWVYFNALGTINGMPRVSHDQYTWCINNGGRAITPEQAANIPGALLFVSGGREPGRISHIEISLGNNRSIGTRKDGTPASEIGYRPGYYDLAALMPSVNYPAVPATVSATGAPGGVGSSGSTGGAFVQQQMDTYARTADAILENEGSMASLFGSVPWVPQQVQSTIANQLIGIRSLQNDSPILPYIANLMNATLRQFSSAPNGDFIAWFPDYYGIWGTAAKMVLQPIEVRDFTVTWNDEFLVTHQFVAQSNTVGLDVTTGSAQAISVLNATQSFGIATIDTPGIMGPLFGLEQTDDEALRFSKFMYERFGPRPNVSQIPSVTGPYGEFFMALFLFMQNWAAQYNANIDITFMPELFPGMLIQFPEYNFQAYVNTVEHTVGFGPGGGFKTRINIMAPARIRDTGQDDDLLGLPIARAAGKAPRGQKSSSKTKTTTGSTSSAPGARGPVSADAAERRASPNPRLRNIPEGTS